MQNDFLIWEELLLYKEIYIQLFECKNFVLFLKTIEGSPELIHEKQINTILRRIVSTLKNQFTYLTKLYFIQGI